MEPGQGDRGSKPTIGFAPTRRSEAARVRVIRPVFFVRETRQGRSWVEEKMQKSPNPGTFSSFRPMFLGMSRVGWSAKSSPEERADPQADAHPDGVTVTELRRHHVGTGDVEHGIRVWSGKVVSPAKRAALMFVIPTLSRT